MTLWTYKNRLVSIGSWRQIAWSLTPLICSLPPLCSRSRSLVRLFVDMLNSWWVSEVILFNFRIVLNRGLNAHDQCWAWLTRILLWSTLGRITMKLTRIVLGHSHLRLLAPLIPVLHTAHAPVHSLAHSLRARGKLVYDLSASISYRPLAVRSPVILLMSSNKSTQSHFMDSTNYHDDDSVMQHGSIVAQGAKKT